MFMLEYRAVAWWYWLATVGLLTVGVFGWPAAFPLAIGLTVFQLLHFSIREGRISAFPVQVRLGYLLVLLLALPERLQWMYWLPMIGTWAQVLFGYCAMARTLSLLPWNREARFSFVLLKQTFFSAPVKGKVMQGLPRA